MQILKLSPSKVDGKTTTWPCNVSRRCVYDNNTMRSQYTILYCKGRARFTVPVTEFTR